MKKKMKKKTPAAGFEPANAFANRQCCSSDALPFGHAGYLLGWCSSGW